jgi:thiamine biosynthesis protein ThiI
VGQDIKDYFRLNVDLTDPDIELFIEIRGDQAFIFVEKIEGPGGMPQGTQGLVLASINNMNSLIATWYILKRGCSVIFHITDPSMIDKTQEFLHYWFIKTKVMKADVKESLWKQINALTAEHKCSALVSGISFSLDKNEAIERIKAMKKRIDVPLLFPLIAFSDTEIKKKAELLGLNL